MTFFLARLFCETPLLLSHPRRPPHPIPHPLSLVVNPFILSTIARSSIPSLRILDRFLPGKNGGWWCFHIQHSGTPHYLFFFFFFLTRLQLSSSLPTRAFHIHNDKMAMKYTRYILLAIFVSVLHSFHSRVVFPMSNLIVPVVRHSLLYFKIIDPLSSQLKLHIELQKAIISAEYGCGRSTS